MTLDNVPRIDPPGDDDFVAQVLAPATPVVIRGLYRHDRIAAVRTREDAVEAWGKLSVPVQLEYTTRHMIRGLPAQMDVMSLARFLARSPDDPDTSKLVVAEQPMPAPMRAWFEPPRCATLAGATLDDMECKIFVAHSGHYAHMHYDLDGRAVLLTQVFGRKRVWVVSPERGQRLDPMTELAGHWSSLFIENLSLEDKLALARSVGAHDTILEPGDTIFIPTAWWHYVDYVDPGMSFNIRLGRTPPQQALFAIAKRLLPRHTHYWQGIAQLFATGRTPTAGELDALDGLLEAFAAAGRGDPADVARFGERVVDLYRRALPAGYRDVFHANDLVRATAVDALAEAAPDPRAATEVPAGWSPTASVALGRGIEVASTLGRGGEELIVLAEGLPSWRVGAESMPEAYALVRAILTVLAAEAAPLPVAELAQRVGANVAELLEILDELGETGAVVAG